MRCHYNGRQPASFGRSMTICHRPVASGHEPVRNGDLILRSPLPARRATRTFFVKHAPGFNSSCRCSVAYLPRARPSDYRAFQARHRP